MAELLVGPILRHVGPDAATVWVETDAPCEVSVLGGRERTFCVSGHHYALVGVGGLDPGTQTAYTVQLDGRTVWPRQDDGFPPCVIRTLSDEHLTVAFGSCRATAPHEPPYTLPEGEDPRGHGVDALRLFALRAAEDPTRLPDVLLMLGDQLYADDPPPEVAERVGAREHESGTPPTGHLEDFTDYAYAYRVAWTEPAIRWLLSTVPTFMIFDDHEIVDEWQISLAWLEDMRAKPWYERRVTGGLAAYWLYQHLGNLSPSDLEADELLARVRRADDGWPQLREFAKDADRMVERSRWSYAARLGPARLVVLDTRAGRRLGPGERRILDDPEWRWVDGRLRGDVRHLLVASSLPAFLSPGMQDLETFVEAACRGRFGDRAARRAERARRALNMGHWPTFEASLRHLCASLGEVAAGRRGQAPSSVLLLAGDVHHSFVTEVAFPSQIEARSPVWQLVASPFRKELARRERAAMRFGASRTGTRLGRLLRWAAGAEDPPVRWRLVSRPTYHNNVATLRLDGERAHVRLEALDGDTWDEAHLRTIFERRLA